MSVARSKVKLAMDTFEHLRFTDQGKERFSEVLQLLDKLEGEQHPLFQKIYEELVAGLSYLNSYGAVVDGDEPRRCFQITLGRDFAPPSFTLTWSRLNTKNAEYQFAFNGGLIWHGGGNDPFCVSLSPQFWGIHT